MLLKKMIIISKCIAIETTYLATVFVELHRVVPACVQCNVKIRKYLLIRLEIIV